MQPMANILTTALREMPGKINGISICVLEHPLPVFSENGVLGLVCYCESIFSTVSIITVMRRYPEIQLFRNFQN